MEVGSIVAFYSKVFNSVTWSKWRLHHGTYPFNCQNKTLRIWLRLQNLNSTGTVTDDTLPMIHHTSSANYILIFNLIPHSSTCMGLSMIYGSEPLHYTSGYPVESIMRGCYMSLQSHVSNHIASLSVSRNMQKLPWRQTGSPLYSAGNFFST